MFGNNKDRPIYNNINQYNNHIWESKKDITNRNRPISFSLSQLSLTERMFSGHTGQQWTLFFTLPHLKI